MTLRRGHWLQRGFAKSPPLMPPRMTMSGRRQATRTAAFFPLSHALRAAGRSLQHSIALDLENLNYHLPQGVFIFGHEDGFATTAQGGINHQFRFLGRLSARRKIDPKGGALVRLALPLQPALVLPDNTENRGQAQAGALPDGLG